MNNFWLQNENFLAIPNMLCDKINKRNEEILSEKSENRRAISSAIGRGDFMILQPKLQIVA